MSLVLLLPAVAQVTPPSWQARSTNPAMAAKSNEVVMVHDELRGQTLLIGHPGGPYCGARRTETWAWDGTSWSDLQPRGNPPYMCGHAAARDPRRDRIVLFDGHTSPWEWDGVTWTQVPTALLPPTRSEHQMAWDPVRGRVLLFGGSRLGIPGGRHGDTWEWEARAGPSSRPATTRPRSSAT